MLFGVARRFGVDGMRGVFGWMIRGSRGGIVGEMNGSNGIVAWSKRLRLGVGG